MAYKPLGLSYKLDYRTRGWLEIARSIRSAKKSGFGGVHVDDVKARCIEPQSAWRPTVYWFPEAWLDQQPWMTVAPPVERFET